MKDWLLRNACVFMLAILTGFILLYLAYLLPTAPMREHLSCEMEALEEHWGVSPFYDRPNAEIDIWTDYHMLAIAANEGNGPTYKEVLKAAYMAPQGTGYDQLDILRSTLSPSSSDTQIMYARYWHGYLVPLKIQLLVADYYTILLYNGIALLALTCLVVYLIAKRGLQRYLPAVMLAVGIASPVSIGMCMQFYACTYIALIATAIILKFHESLVDNGRYGTFFMLVGMATSYFDFLTTPIVTLGIPLCACLLVSHGHGRVRVRDVAALAMLWGMGYAGMWASKWIVSSMFLKSNVLKEAASQIAMRTSSFEGASMQEANGAITFPMVVGACWERILGPTSNKAFVALMLLYPAGTYVAGIAKRRTKDPGSLTGQPVVYLVLVAIALLPFAWSFCLKNHTYMHAYFTFRMFTITLLALACIPLVRDESQTGRDQLGEVTPEETAPRHMA